MRIANSILAWVSLTMWMAVLGAGGAHAGEVSLEELWRAEPFTLSAEALRSVVVPKVEGGSATLVHTSGDRYDASHRLTRTDHLVVRILNQRGVESWGTVSAGWGPWYEARPEVRARVVTADGRELKLDPATVTEATAPSTTSTVTDRQGAGFLDRSDGVGARRGDLADRGPRALRAGDRRELEWARADTQAVGAADGLWRRDDGDPVGVRLWQRR